MKTKLFFAAFLSIAIMACSGGAKNTTENTTTPEATAETPEASSDFVPAFGEGDKDGGIDIKGAKGLMTMKDAADKFDSRPTITPEERTELKIVQFFGDNFDTKWKNEELSKGKIIYQGERGRLETLLHIVKGKSVNEFLVSYDPNGKFIDCISLGTMSASGDKGEGMIKGNVVISRFSSVGNSVYKKYEITPKLKFEKKNEWQGAD